MVLHYFITEVQGQGIIIIIIIIIIVSFTAILLALLRFSVPKSYTQSLGLLGWGSACPKAHTYTNTING
jgi:hypothetical protein